MKKTYLMWAKRTPKGFMLNDMGEVVLFKQKSDLWFFEEAKNKLRVRVKDTVEEIKK